MVRPEILQGRRKLGVPLSQRRDLMKEPRVPGSSIPILHPGRNPRSFAGLHSRMIRGVQAPQTHYMFAHEYCKARKSAGLPLRPSHALRFNCTF